MTRVPLAALLAANVISITGNRLTQLAIPWFVLQTTGSVAKTGLVGFFSLLPFVISSALGGVIVDRLGYRRASIVSDLASGSSVLLVPILYHTVGLPLAALLGLVFAGALLDAPGQTAREAILPDLVERAGTTLERGTSLFDGVSRGANMLGAPLAGALIAVMGPANVLILDAATFSPRRS
ncbi:MAG: MFS transporter [Gaiellaceae bacterium MAG52_C11]|nr:MFS transporter [Candidatus Gaiellasilicea maunaloa]